MPAVILGIVTIFYLTDWPEQAAWLPEDERRWIISALESEKRTKQTANPQHVAKALRQPNVLLLALAYFCMTTSVYGVTFWLPTIIKKLSGLSNLLVTLTAALPYCVGLAAILLTGWSSDRTKERRWHAALCMAIASAGLLLSVVFQNTTLLAVLMFSLPALGMYGSLPGFWSLPTSFLTATPAAASTTFINLTQQ